MSMVQDNQCGQCGCTLWAPDSDAAVAFIAIEDAQICHECAAANLRARSILKPPVKVNEWRVTDEQRLRLTVTLNRFLRECAESADDKWQSGCSGYVGTIKLSAHAQDEGLTFTVERSFEESV